MKGPATLHSVSGFRGFNHPPTLMVTEPWSIQVACSWSMSWCRALLMVPQDLRWVVSSGAGHPVLMRGILAFARTELMILGGWGRLPLVRRAAPHAFDALTGQTPPMEGLVPGRVRVRNGGWQLPVSCPGVYRVRCAFGAGQQSVRRLPCFAVGDEHI